MSGYGEHAHTGDGGHRALTLSVPAALAQTASPPTSAASAVSYTASGSPGPTTLVGTWTSAPFELALSSDFDRSVWGANATSVRTVALQVGASGEATLTVTRKWLTPANGRSPSTSVEEAQIRIGSPGT